jgi:hypothetical protein
MEASFFCENVFGNVESFQIVCGNACQARVRLRDAIVVVLMAVVNAVDVEIYMVG